VTNAQGFVTADRVAGQRDPSPRWAIVLHALAGPAAMFIPTGVAQWPSTPSPAPVAAGRWIPHGHDGLGAG
jgi:hypothetical protein